MTTEYKVKIVDLAGNELKVGDVIINATKCTNSAYLRIGYIHDIYRDSKLNYRSGNPLILHIRNLIVSSRYVYSLGKYFDNLTVTGIKKHISEFSYNNEPLETSTVECFKTFKSLKESFKPEVYDKFIKGTKYDKL